jgi:hypothetical protein
MMIPSPDSPACLAAIATFFTVDQMSRQRTESYHPELVLSSVIFHARSEIENGLPTSWSPWSPVITDGVGKAESPNSSFAIPLGLGAAKNIAVHWSFPVEDFVKQIDQLAKSAGVPAQFSFKNGIFQIDSKLFGQSLSLWKNQQNTNIDYVLPASAQREPTALVLPDAYIKLTSAIMQLSAMNKDPTKSLPGLPALKVDFEYWDIADGKHKASFDVEMEVSRFGVGFIGAYLKAKKRS